MTRHLSILLLCSSSMIITGCSSNNVAAKDANLWQASSNVHSGKYDKDLKQKRGALNTSRSELIIAKRRAVDLEAGVKNVQQEKQQLDRELTQVSGKNASLSREIQNMRSETQAERANKVKLSTKANRINSEIASLKKRRVSQPSMPPKDYEKRIKALEKEVELLRKLHKIQMQTSN